MVSQRASLCLYGFSGSLRAANIFSPTKKESPKSADTQLPRSSNDLQKVQSEIIIRNTSVEPGLCKALYAVSNDILAQVWVRWRTYGAVRGRWKHTSCIIYVKYEHLQQTTRHKRFSFNQEWWLVIEVLMCEMGGGGLFVFSSLSGTFWRSPVVWPR